MKKALFICLLAALSVQLSAQYKKAGFFTREGRTYSLSTTMFNMGDGKGSPLGFTFSSGSDNTQKRTIFWYDITFIPGYNFSYTTTGTIANSNSTVNDATIYGKSRSVWIYGFNYGIYLTKHDAESKFNLYIPLGFNIVIAGRPQQASLDLISEQYYDLDKSPAQESFNFGLKGGLGAIYNITQKWGVKLEGGYNRVFNVDVNNTSGNSYFMFTNNSYVTLGIRLRLLGDD